MTGLEPFVPAATRPWDREAARHLLERAGFGGPPDEIDNLVRLGPGEAVEQLLAAPVDDETLPDFLGAETAAPELRRLSPKEREQALRELRRQARVATQGLKAWWLQRMVTTPHPAREKLTLFWHGHFATEARKVKSPRLLYEQNQLLRRLGAGPFGDLVLAVSRDPAMLIYLDNDQNVRGRPNENYARELLELFTLGLGHYTEQDVQEAARAFTGWTLNRRRPGGFAAPRFVVDAARHDDGEKTFLGERGRLDGEDVIRVVLAQPAAAEFLAGKLWRAFVSDTLAPEDQAAVAALAHTLRQSGYQVGEALAHLFRSDVFYAPRHRGNRIKSPVELVVGTLRRLRFSPDERVARGLCAALAGMGQDLFEPPNVAGWPGGRAWINTSTLMARYNLTAHLLGGPGGRGARARPAAAFGAAPLDPVALVDSLAAEWLAVPLTGPQRDALTAQAAALAGRSPDAGRAVLHLLLSTPNYQVH